MEPIDFAIVAAVVLAVGAAGYFVGRFTAKRSKPVGATEKRLDEYAFYPFEVNQSGHVEFSADAFDEATKHFLVNRNERAARELVVIGQQNLVRDTFPSDRLARYKELYSAYNGDAVISENDMFLENYKRIVNQLGRSFPRTGIEFLVHDLVNPSRSLVAIENGEVTGRSIGSGATNLVLDLKTRRERGEDKVNYELNIGSRRFKCTTIAIFRPEYGLVGALCVNVDAAFIRDIATTHKERLDAFIENLIRTDFELDENILSKSEYQNALNGKRDYLDDAIRSRGASQHRQLAAIFFSDIVAFTALMERDEAMTLAIVETNTDIHRKAIADHRGQLLKKLGDGILASFPSVVDAVACADAVQREVDGDDRFQIRIGIHMGAVIRADGDIHGDAVNIASRIQGEMNPGEVGFSDVVYNNTKNQDDISASFVGERRLKNVTDPVPIYVLDR